MLARKDGALNVRCTLRMRFCASYISSFKTFFSILGYTVLSFGRIWVSIGVVRHPVPIQWVPRTLSLGVKRPGREADHSPPSSAEVKNAWSYTSTPQYVFMAWCLVKHRDAFLSYQICRLYRCSLIQLLCILDYRHIFPLFKHHISVGHNPLPSLIVYIILVRSIITSHKRHPSKFS
jgi:hypothetical protein